jgi:lipid II:glycine glycyltransferase (peptidoglycan interpeptide bridge formation enzyme)
MDDLEGLGEIVYWLSGEVEKKKVKYVEVRPLKLSMKEQGDFTEASKFCLHTLDIQPTTETLFQNLHKDSIRRKIERARRENLTYESGTSRLLLRKFYRLFVMTRRRHGLPPSPFSWFCNLIDCLGERIQIRIASKDGTPVAGMVTLTYKNCVVYKYGASDVRFNNLGGMPLLFWSTILESKSQGLQELDLGRSDMDNDGLVTFKDRWGSRRSRLTYWKSPQPSAAPLSSGHSRVLKRLFSFAPDRLSIEVGNLLYRHLG